MPAFFDLLARVESDVLVDVRSSPFTRYSLHFCHGPLKEAVQSAGLKYLFLGKELGGVPKNEQFYDEDGYVLYERIAESEPFKEAIGRLLSGVENYNVMLMCGEENPLGCHRRLLVARVLQENGVDVLHMRSDGRLDSEQDLRDMEAEAEGRYIQLSLLESIPEPAKPWRSAKPVNRRRD